ncbi:MAG: alpha/beta fold hydrolase [Sciscionella sp.]
MGGTVARAAASRLRRPARRRGGARNPPKLGELRPDRRCAIGTTDGVPLAVQEIDPTDGGKPELTVFLVHGLALSARSWCLQAAALAASTAPRVRVVLYDQRGHGESGKGAPGSARISVLGKDLAVVLQALAPKGPLLLIGHSMGGMAIMELARTQPELFASRIRGVGLIATSAGELGAHGLPRPALSKYNPITKAISGIARLQPELVEWVRNAGGGLTRYGVRKIAFGSGEVPASLVDFMVEMLASTPVSVLTTFIRTLGAHSRHAALAALVPSQVLVLAGDADALTPPQHSERIAAEVPGAQLLMLAGAGHMVILERPQQVNEALGALLHRCSKHGTTIDREGRRGA